jgi:hypothetical protein
MEDWRTVLPADTTTPGDASMAEVFKDVRCSACSAEHDVYVDEPVVRKRVHQFTCPATGERVTLSPKGKLSRHVDVVPAGAVLATIGPAVR